LTRGGGFLVRELFTGRATIGVGRMQEVGGGGLRLPSQGEKTRPSQSAVGAIHKSGGKEKLGKVLQNDKESQGGNELFNELWEKKGQDEGTKGTNHRRKSFDYIGIDPSIGDEGCCVELSD